MLTAVIVMVAVGTMAQYSDVFFTGESDDTAASAPIILTADSVETTAGQLERIDVLANDIGVLAVDRSRLRVIAEPTCGSVFVQDGALQYLSTRECNQFQTVTYDLDGIAGIEPALVQIRIKGAPVAQTPEPAAVVAKAPVGTDASPEAPSIATELAEVSSQPPATPVIDEQLAPQAPTQNLADPAALARAEPADAPVAPGSRAPAPLPRPAPVAEAAPSALDDLASVAPALGLTPTAPEIVAEGLALPLEQPDAPAQPDLALADPTETPVVTGTAPEQLGNDVEANVGVVRFDIVEPASDSPAEPIFAFNPFEELPTETGSAVSRAAPERQDIAALTPSDIIRDLPVDVGRMIGAPVRHTPQLPSIARPPAEPVTGGVAYTEPSGIGPLQRSIGAGEEAPSVLNLPARAAPKPREEERVAALTPGGQDCVTPPALTFDIKPFAQTVVAVNAPCAAGTVATVSYGEITLALPLDRAGNGSLTVPGFERSSAARLKFADGKVERFELPFSGISKVARIALVWDGDIELDMHALEFGSVPFAEGDVHEGNPRDQDAVRRSGGGFLQTYAPVRGFGQNVEIYSHVISRKGEGGVVELYVDYVSRNRDRLAETCSEGRLARPKLTVLRSERGELGRPQIMRLAALSCTEISDARDGSAFSSIGSLVVAP